MFCIAATENDIVRLKGGFELLSNLRHLFAPFLFAEPLEPGQTDLILVGPAFLVGQVGEFSRFKDAIDD